MIPKPPLSLLAHHFPINEVEDFTIFLRPNPKKVSS